MGDHGVSRAEMNVGIWARQAHRVEIAANQDEVSATSRAR
jgi:hypothetical protein